MRLAVPYTLPPMEAKPADELPVGDDWQYEPKWDGFRCLAFRNGSSVRLQSKSGQALARYFPELVDALGGLDATRFVLDGEIVVPVGDRLSFDDLLQRIHPAASRVQKLASERPASLVLFDLIVDASGRSLMDETLVRRRPALEAFFKQVVGAQERLRLSPATADIAEARRWFAQVGGDLDGIVAKRRDLGYRSGERDGMVKVKHKRTVDCVVGGFRYATKGKQVGSLLLGLFNEEGKLNHVGFTSSFAVPERARVTRLIEPLKSEASFTGRAPGGPSRWSTKRTSEWQPVTPRLVVEVEYDHFSGHRFRHGTRIVRWRPDKAPRQCTMEQIDQSADRTFQLLGSTSPVTTRTKRGSGKPVRAT